MSVRSHRCAFPAVLVLALLLAGYTYGQSKGELKLERLVLLIATPLGHESTLTLDDSQAIETGSRPAAVSVVPVLDVRDKVVAGEKSHAPSQPLHGTTREFLDIRGRKVDQGRMWTNNEQKDRAKVCVLGRTVTTELFGAESPLGKTIRLKDSSLKVIGTLAPKGADALRLDPDDIVLIPLGTLVEAAKRLAAEQRPAGIGSLGIYVRVGSEKEISAAVRQISTILRKRHRIRPGQPDDFEMRYLGEPVNTPGR